MFNKLLAKVGIGATKVDFILDEGPLAPNAPFSGTIHIEGGKVEQEINGINLLVKTIAETETEDGEIRTEHTLQNLKINEKFVCKPGEQRAVNVRGHLHPEVPVSAINCHHNATEVWFQTELDVEMALDPSDRDYIAVLPTPFIASFLQAMDQLGFVLFTVDVESGQLNGPNFQSTVGCYQEFEFKPNFRSIFNEIEVSFISGDDQTHVLIEADVPGRGDIYLSESFANTMQTQELSGFIRNWLGL